METISPGRTSLFQRLINHPRGIPSSNVYSYSIPEFTHAHLRHSCNIRSFESNFVRALASSGTPLHTCTITLQIISVIITRKEAEKLSTNIQNQHLHNINKFRLHSKISNTYLIYIHNHIILPL